MAILIKDIKELVTCRSKNNQAKSGKLQSDIGLMKDANVFIEKDKIKFIGSVYQLRKFLKEENPRNYDVLDASGKIAMPGFIDSHTHFVFSGSREDEYEMRLSGMTYQEIAKKGGGILSTVKSLRKTSKEELKKIAEKRLKKFVSYGTTTLEGKSGYGLDLANEIKTLQVINELNKNKYNLDIIPTFLGAHAVPTQMSKKEYIEEIKFNMIPFVKKENHAVFIDAFCEKNYFTPGEVMDIFGMGKKFGLIPKLHTNQFNSTGGIEAAIESKAYSADHLEVMNEDEIKNLTAYNKKKSNRKIISTLLPGVSYFLEIPYSPARELIENNNPVALATDFNPGSCMTENIQMIMSLASLKMKMTAEEILNAVTINAAYSLDLENSIGSIEIGKQADLLIFDMTSYKYLTYNFGVNNLEYIIKKGKIVHKN